MFEHVIAERLEVYLWTNDNQFGFKSGHLTDLCIYALTLYSALYTFVYTKSNTSPHSIQHANNIS